jgi:hypothetical protein
MRRRRDINIPSRRTMASIVLIPVFNLHSRCLLDPGHLCLGAHQRHRGLPTWVSRLRLLRNPPKATSNAPAPRMSASQRIPQDILELLEHSSPAPTNGSYISLMRCNGEGFSPRSQLRQMMGSNSATCQSLRGLPLSNRHRLPWLRSGSGSGTTRLVVVVPNTKWPPSLSPGAVLTARQQTATATGSGGSSGSSRGASSQQTAATTMTVSEGQR